MSGRDAARLEAAIKERFAPVAGLEPIAADASVRQFFRLTRPTGQTEVVLVDAAGGPAAQARMVAAHAVLSGAGLRVPALIDADEALAALLLEDLGDRLLADALPELPEERRRELYAEAGRMAARIATLGTRVVTADHALAWPRLARERLRIELAFFAVHDVAGRRDVRDRERLAALGDLSDSICQVLSEPTPQLAHRDFHARNLMLLPDGSLAAVDFQDALLAPPGYDLASLIRDPYVEPGAALQTAAAEAYAAELGRKPEEVAGGQFAWVALQRNLKAIGTYAYQALRLGRTRFLAHIPGAERLALRAARELPAEHAGRAAAVLEAVGFRASSRA